MPLRLIRKNTFIIPFRSRDNQTESLRSWVAFYRQPRNWEMVFSKALELLMEEPIVLGDAVTFAGQSGKIAWRETRLWTIIRLEFRIYSIKKRQLIAAGLLKSARNASGQKQEDANG